jgi:hypothetical protein
MPPKKPDFLDYFYGIRISEKEIESFWNYSKTKELKSKGLSIGKIHKILGNPRRRIEHWFYEKNMPFVSRLEEYYDKLGKPEKNKKWLSINSTKGGLFTGPWIQVPSKVKGFEDVKKVIGQIEPLKETYERANEFELNKKDVGDLRYYFFYYLLGLVVGDGSITRGTGKIRISRRITLNLCKRYPTNKRVGKFVVLCLNSIGLRMNRTKDDRPSKKNKHKFFRWHGQCSQLCEWIFDICFGLKEKQNTTYFPIKGEWILKSPKNLRIAFLQGIADSDGYTDISASQVGLITKSNIDLFEKIFDSIEVHHIRKYLHHGTLPTVMINIKKAYELPIFNPYTKSYRWQLVKKIAEAKRLKHQLPKELAEEITKHLKKGCSSVDIVKMLLYKYNLLVRGGSIQKRMRTLKKKGVIEI